MSTTLLAPDTLGPTLCAGEILVEIVATTTGTGFREAQPLVGPFPSGAPAIFIDQCGRFGGSVKENLATRAVFHTNGVDIGATRPMQPGSPRPARSAGRGSPFRTVLSNPMICEQPMLPTGRGPMSIVNTWLILGAVVGSCST